MTIDILAIYTVYTSYRPAGGAARPGADGVRRVARVPRTRCVGRGAVGAARAWKALLYALAFCKVHACSSTCTNECRRCVQRTHTRRTHALPTRKRRPPRHILKYTQGSSQKRAPALGAHTQVGCFTALVLTQ